MTKLLTKQQWLEKNFIGMCWQVKYLHIITLTLSLLILGIPKAYAHDRSESFSKWLWQDNGDLTVSLSVLAREATPLVPSSRSNSHQALSTALVKHFADNVSVFSSQDLSTNTEHTQVTCTLAAKPQSINAQQGYLRLEANFQCPKNTKSITMNIGLFQQQAKNHVHYAMFSKASNGEQAEYFFSQNVSSHNIDLSVQSLQQTSTTLKQVVISHIELGIEHIVFGFDHLLFLFGILLVARSLVELAWLVTGFTIGHSISLAFAVLGYVSPNILLVEAFIGFSIFILACEVMLRHNNSGAILSFVLLAPILIALIKILSGEQLSFALGLGFMAIFSYSYLNLSHRQEKMNYRIKALLTSLFGVVHGFGFASSFLSMGYSGDNLFWKLVTFNIGVEVGQIFILLLSIVVFTLFKKVFKESYIKQTANIMVMTLASMGMFWFLTRLA
ncbi:MAG: HupE/UreJ family protein [Colwellia sp.]|nr:HupE/UreJ family protein [Colwellia sp.]MCW8863640.1 HupE/UreJ family protein [Colwellia sp.]MCW9080392.1 HupE/UreJ family protein [Colwellia sp.]